MQNNSTKLEMFLSKEKSDSLINLCLAALPRKAYGLAGGPDCCPPAGFYPRSTNLRNVAEWKRIFDSFGEFYRNPDLGFVIEPDEVRKVMQTMEERKETFIGVFHSHRYLPATPSEVDMALSSDSSVFCYIVSVVDPADPKLAIFRLEEDTFQQFIICSE